MLENLAQLDDYMKMHEIATDEDVFLSPREWMTLAGLVGPYHIVPASPDEPALFWFLGRRVRQRR